MFHPIPPIQTNLYRTNISFAGFLLLLVVLQNVQPYFCHHNIQNYNKRLSSVEPSPDIVPADKRTLISGSGIGGSAGQPEEIFSASDQLESNYDEYPMVVPKRAALLLDRLMVALHHALEKEHSGSARLSEFYNNKNQNKIPPHLALNDRNKDNDDDNDIGDKDDNTKDSPYVPMYSDDDPTVMMDYDFKDLNSINRATGETLMAQSFQRRANMGLDLGGDIGMEGVSSLLASSPSLAHSGFRSGDISSGSGGVVGSGSVGIGEGRTNRMYWRCYFNAVSCF